MPHLCRVVHLHCGHRVERYPVGRVLLGHLSRPGRHRMTNEVAAVARHVTEGVRVKDRIGRWLDELPWLGVVRMEVLVVGARPAECLLGTLESAVGRKGL